MRVLATSKPFAGTAGAWLVVHQGDQFLIARRAEFCEQDVGKWNWIGGGVDEGERPIQAALREFKEEAGVNLSSFARDLTHVAAIHNPLLGGVCHFFLLELDSIQDLESRLKLNEESNGHQWVTMAELMQMFHVLNWPTQASLGPIISYLGSSL